MFLHLFYKHCTLPCLARLLRTQTDVFCNSLAACWDKSHWQGETGMWGTGPCLLWASVPLGFTAEAGFMRSKALSAQAPVILTLSFVSLRPRSEAQPPTSCKAAMPFIICITEIKLCRPPVASPPLPHSTVACISMFCHRKKQSLNKYGRPRR